MRDRGLVLAGGLALLLFSATAGWTETDIEKMLVGRWTGEVQTGAGKTFDRTLVIKSVQERYGQMVPVAEYGGQGLGAELYPVDGVIERINGEVVLRIFTPERRTAVLTLQKDGKRLMGPVSGAAQVGKSNQADDSLSLRKSNER